MSDGTQPATNLTTAFDSNAATTVDQTMNEIADIFGFNDTASSVGTVDGEGAGDNSPPAPTSTEPTGEPVAAPVVTAPEAPAPAAAPAAQPATPPAPTAAELELAALKERLAKLEAPAPAPEPAPATKPEGAAPEGEGNLKPIAYKGQLPNDVMGAIFGEDPVAAAQAMNGIVNSLATHLHTTFREELSAAVQLIETRFGQRLQSLQQGDMQQQQQTAVQEAEADYYSTFPQHKNPLYAGIIGQCSSQLATEYPDLKWGEQFRNALGARVDQQLRALGITPTAANVAAPSGVDTPRAPVAASPAAPAAFVPSGNRVPVADGNDAADLIAETFSFN